jgi:hypothetical protein
MISIDRLDRILPYIGNKQVTDLYIDGSDIRTISALSTLSGMQFLQLPNSRQLDSLAGIESHADLQEISLILCPNITDYSPLLDLPNLKRLTLSINAEPLAAVQLAGAPFEIVYQDK